jgi:hypothetical protein
MADPNIEVLNLARGKLSRENKRIIKVYLAGPLQPATLIQLWNMYWCRYDIVYNQELPLMIRSNIVHDKTKKLNVLGIFLDRQEPTDEELREIITQGDEKKENWISRVLFIVSQHPEFLEKQEIFDLMIVFVRDYVQFYIGMTELNVNRVAKITQYALRLRSDNALKYLDTLLMSYNKISHTILERSLKRIFISDEIVHYLMKRIGSNNAIPLLKMAIKRNNMSDSSEAQLLLY